MRIGYAATAAALLLAGCGTAGVEEREFNATLTGHQVVGGGEMGGTGQAQLRFANTRRELCWRLNVRGVEAPTAVHVHRGAAGTEGPPVLTLTTPAADGQSEGCSPIEDGLARQLAAGPHDFYVNVHNRAWPGGAIRGQLRGRGPIRPRRVRDD